MTCCPESTEPCLWNVVTPAAGEPSIQGGAGAAERTECQGFAELPEQVVGTVWSLFADDCLAIGVSEFGLRLEVMRTRVARLWHNG